MAVNATGAFLCTRAFLPGMLERRWGRVVNVASTAGLGGGKYLAAYSAAKHALVGLTRSAAAEVAGSGVTVNAVCPGFVDTGMTAETLARIVAKTGRTPGRGAGRGARLGRPDAADLCGRRSRRRSCRSPRAGARAPNGEAAGPGRERPDERPLRDRQSGGARRAAGMEQRHAGPGRRADAVHRRADGARRLGPGPAGRLRRPSSTRAGQRAGRAPRGRRRAGDIGRFTIYVTDMAQYRASLKPLGEAYRRRMGRTIRRWRWSR